jgi:site-specific DNA-cytosine methylase
LEKIIMPKMLDLFCGTKSMAKAFEKAGWETYTVDWEKEFEPTLCCDVNTLTVEKIIELCGGVPDFVHMSPDCTSYSVAAISHHRRKNEDTGELEAVTDYAKFCDKTNAYIIDLIVNQLKPKFYTIENPRGAMRKMSFVKDLPMYTVTYCQYGDSRQKPTDIWTNIPNPNFIPPCKPGSSCHEAAPRGSRTGTQGINGAEDRSRIPDALCDYIVELCKKKYYNTK